MVTYLGSEGSNKWWQGKRLLGVVSSFCNCEPKMTAVMKKSKQGASLIVLN